MTVTPHEVYEDLKHLMPGLLTHVNSPCTPLPLSRHSSFHGDVIHRRICAIGDVVGNVIVHLNDYHYWNRAQIADWLDTLDVDLTFPAEPTPRPEPEPVSRRAPEVIVSYADADAQFTTAFSMNLVYDDNGDAWPEVALPDAYSSADGYSVYSSSAIPPWTTVVASGKISAETTKLLVGEPTDSELAPVIAALQKKYGPPVHVALLEEQEKKRRRTT